jgi:hypothetical protein
MSSFQFPANPSDGDIVVRGNLQAFYNAATNTWRVSEVPTAPGIPGPPGPPGPIGPEGKGVQISGAVDTFADLPAPNAHQFEFWIVDDTNTLYNSDGITWRDLGGPIQGPQGDPGEDGTNGTNGQNGRGWYDTNIIDERPSNYQVQFLSNDGLGFTTDNIMGPKGDDGDMEVASEDNCGCIKIGRGLSLEPDGTVNAGQTYVDVETTPLPGRYIFGFRPSYSEFQPASYDGAWVDRQDDVEFANETIEVDVPEGSTGAIVSWFQNSGMNGNPDRNSTSGINTFMGFVYSSVEVSNPAVYVQSNMGINFTHNVATHTYVGSVNERTNTIVGTKLNEIRYPLGTTKISFTRKVVFVRGRHVRVGVGFGRLVVQPYRDEDVDIRNIQTFDADIDPSDPEFIPPLTPDEVLTAKADDLRSDTRDGIDAAVTILNLPDGYVNDAEKAQALTHLDILLGARNLPGTPEEVDAAIRPSINALNALLDFKYRFEP